MKKMIIVVAAVVMMVSGAFSAFAEVATIPDNAKVCIVEYGKKNTTLVAITGVEVVRTEIYSHLRVAPKLPLAGDNANAFLLDPGQGFNFQFVTHDGSVKWAALTGNEHIFGQPYWLCEGLVVLPVQFGGNKGAEIFVKKYLHPELQKAIDSGQPIKPLFIN